MPYLQPSLTKQGTTDSGTSGKDFYVPVSGNANIVGSLTVDGVIDTTGPVGSAGLVINNQQHISMLNAGSTVESLRLEGSLSAPPGLNPTATFSTQADGTFQFGIIGGVPAPQTSILVSATPNGDSLNVGGDMYATGEVLSGSFGLVLDADPANAIYGSATLTAGLATITTTQADAGSIILLTRTGVNASTFLGELRIREKNVGNFVVESTNPSAPPGVQTADESSFDWIIIKTQ